MTGMSISDTGLRVYPDPDTVMQPIQKYPDIKAGSRHLEYSAYRLLIWYIPRRRFKDRVVDADLGFGCFCSNQALIRKRRYIQ